MMGALGQGYEPSFEPVAFFESVYRQAGEAGFLRNTRARDDLI